MSLSLELEKLLPQPKYEDTDVTYQEDDEEEALSLCDLPVSKPNEDQEIQQEAQNGEVDDFAFDFGSLIGSIPALESDMCVADEVFSGGQMLPFRHSVSSESGLTRFRVPNRVVSRTASMDRTRFGSCSSSRSSSTRSHQSNSSSTTSTTTSSNNSRGTLRDPKPRNQFYSYPSPNARVRNSSGGRISTSTMSSGSKSTMWQVLRLGLVRTPEIELQGRTNNIYINKSNKNSSTKVGDLLSELPRRNSNLMYDEKNNEKGNDNNNGGFFKSCKCAVGAIEPLPITRINGNSSPRSSKSLASQVLNEDGQKRNINGKQRMSNHRTFEWLRDLSHPNILNS